MHTYIRDGMYVFTYLSLYIYILVVVSRAFAVFVIAFDGVCGHCDLCSLCVCGSLWLEFEGVYVQLLMCVMCLQFTARVFVLRVPRDVCFAFVFVVCLFAMNSPNRVFVFECDCDSIVCVLSLVVTSQSN